MSFIQAQVRLLSLEIQLQFSDMPAATFMPPSLPFWTAPSKACSCRSLFHAFPRNALRSIHSTSIRTANPLPITATGPPPAAPLPPASERGSRIDRRRQQAELLQQNREVRASDPSGKAKSPLKQRFWKDVSVEATPGTTNFLHLAFPSAHHLSTQRAIT